MMLLNIAQTKEQSCAHTQKVIANIAYGWLSTGYQRLMYFIRNCVEQTDKKRIQPYFFCMLLFCMLCEMCLCETIKE